MRLALPIASFKSVIPRAARTALAARASRGTCFRICHEKPLVQRLHSRQQIARHLHWNNQRPKAPGLRTQERRNRGFQQKVPLPSSGLLRVLRRREQGNRPLKATQALEQSKESLPDRAPKSHLGGPSRRMVHAPHVPARRAGPSTRQLTASQIDWLGRDDSTSQSPLYASDKTKSVIPTGALRMALPIVMRSGGTCWLESVALRLALPIGSA